MRSFDNTWSSNVIGSCTRQQSSSKLQFECSLAGNIGHNSSFLYDKHDSRARHRHISGESVEGRGEGGIWWKRRNVGRRGCGREGCNVGRRGCGREGCNVGRRGCGGEGRNERRRGCGAV